MRINVYALFNNELNSIIDGKANRYYYAPLSLLNHKSAKSSVNVNANPSQKYQVEFDVEMWNENLQKEVVDWIRRKDKTVEEDFVQITPFEQVMLGFACNTCFHDHCIDV